MPRHDIDLNGNIKTLLIVNLGPTTRRLEVPLPGSNTSTFY